MTTWNKYDSFIDTLIKKFSTIPNFNLIQEEGPNKTFFEFIVRRFVELDSLKSLFINYYIPTAEKATSDDLTELSKSKYKSLVQLTEHDIKENYYETVRLGYVSIYHKYEVFIKELLINTELVFPRTNNKNISLEKYIEKNFDFKIKNPLYSPTLHRINYICNCTKHYDGYPKKETKPKVFENLPTNIKLEFTVLDFQKDIGFLMNHYHYLLSAVLFSAAHKMFYEEIHSTLDNIENNSGKEKILTQIRVVDTNIRQLIDVLKEIAPRTC